MSAATRTGLLFRLAVDRVNSPSPDTLCINLMIPWCLVPTVMCVCGVQCFPNATFEVPFGMFEAIQQLFSVSEGADAVGTLPTKRLCMVARGDEINRH